MNIRASKHCYYGNLSTLLNKNRYAILESELVLLSQELQCSMNHKENYISLGFDNNKSSMALEKLSCEMIKLDSECGIKEYFEENSSNALLVYINTKALDYNSIFKGTDRFHYIIIDNFQEGKISIVDSFIQTIPVSVFHGFVNSNKIIKNIANGTATAHYLRNLSHRNHFDDAKLLFIQYLDENVLQLEESIINKSKKYCMNLLNNLDLYMTKKSLYNTAYNLRVNGFLARLDYILELYELYAGNKDLVATQISEIKSSYELMINKIMKASFTLNKQYIEKTIQNYFYKNIEMEHQIYCKMQKQL